MGRTQLTGYRSSQQSILEKTSWMNGIHKDFLQTCWPVARKTKGQKAPSAKKLLWIRILFTHYPNIFTKIQPSIKYLEQDYVWFMCQHCYPGPWAGHLTSETNPSVSQTYSVMGRIGEDKGISRLVSHLAHKKCQCQLLSLSEIC